MLLTIYLISVAICSIDSYFDKRELLSDLSIMDIVYIFFYHLMPGVNTGFATCLIIGNFTEMYDKLYDILTKPRWFTK
jgi:hypothetical protein